MLKWTVAKRDPFSLNAACRSPQNTCSMATTAPASKRKRRSSTTNSRRRRRSSTGGATHRCLDLITSTPIKNSTQDENNTNSKKRSGSDENDTNAAKLEHRKSSDFRLSFDCDTNYFKPFEAVDSHIEGSYLPGFEKFENFENFDQFDKIAMDCRCQHLQRKAFAPTLPTFALDYSPTLNHSPTFLSTRKIDNFLNRIHLIPNSGELKLKLPGYRPRVKDNQSQTPKQSHSAKQGITETPTSKSGKPYHNLVNNFLNKVSTVNKNDSSFINDLSLDKIVDAILDSSNDQSTTSRSPTSTETTETLRISGSSIATTTSTASSDSTSTDSGFRSSTTTIRIISSHEEKTMINLEGTFNERCIDNRIEAVEKLENRKRAFPDTIKDIGSQLKRQKCIRQKPKKKLDLDLDDQFELDLMEPEVNATYVVTSTEEVQVEMAKPRGSTIDFEVQYRKEVDELQVDVFRCGNLRRSNGHPVNAYIKVALGTTSGGGGSVSLQRTAVQPESSSPQFRHCFRIPLQENMKIVPKVDTLYIEAWHRERTTRRSEFLGCASFPLNDAIAQVIRGTYKLHPQWPDGNFNNNNNNNYPIITTKPEVPTMSEVVLHTSIDELIADGSASTTANLSASKVDTSKVEIGNRVQLSEQQKTADENLFLRYLELDPMEGPEAAPALAQRKASGNKITGRTPFTMTRVLRKAPKSGFGFAVVWTHPPRIERVEKGLPADRAGIQPGDYLIFVDKHNVVMTPEVEILDLIRSQGATLTLETFRRDGTISTSTPRPNNGAACIERADSMTTTTTAVLPAPLALHQRRPSTVCSTNVTSMVELSARRRLHLPQVTFSSERPTSSAEEARRKSMYQLIAKEQQYATCMQFAVARYVQPLLERKDLVAATEHRTLFQNCDELLRISEAIIEQLIQVDGDYHTGNLIKCFASKLPEINASYRRYCAGIKRADCVLANLSKNPDFARFITIPAIPRRRPDLTAFVHLPLEHYRDVLQLFQVILSHTKAKHDDEEYGLLSHIVHELQGSYREITSQAGLMEPGGEGRPLLSVQDLETRLVFTKCKPFVLSKPGRQWIFGGDLSRVEGRTMRQYWALLFSDIILFAKVSRDRVLFILEEPLPLAHISEMYFNVRKKENEFRLIIEPSAAAGNRSTSASSPTVHCGPDLSRTPRKQANKRCIVLRTPTGELKAVWQNLLQRQIFHIAASASRGDGSSFSSPTEDSPDCGTAPQYHHPTHSASVMTLQSAESAPHRLPAHPASTTSSQQINNVEKNNNVLNHQPSSEQENRKRLDELIEHKCKELEKTTSSKGNAIHLEQWMKGQFNTDKSNNNVGASPLSEIHNFRDDYEEEDEDIETWTEEQIRQRSEELKLVDAGSAAAILSLRQKEKGQEEMGIVWDDESPSRSTTTESQVTVRSGALEKVSVCQNCHQNCYTLQEHQNGLSASSTKDSNLGLDHFFTQIDPFSMPPKISIIPPTPTALSEMSPKLPEKVPELSHNCTCPNSLPLNTNYTNCRIYNSDYSPDDSPVNDLDEQPYHSLHSSVLTLRRFGTVSSLDQNSEIVENLECLEDDESVIRTTELAGVDNEGFNSTLMTWTARAGSYVAAKMAFLEKLPDYLKSDMLNGEDTVQEEETSGGTSGEEIWGTPTSGGGELDDLGSPQEYNHQSPNGDSASSNEDTELMMDELLMTPPVTAASIRGLLPRRTLEPLMEEEFSDTYSTESESESAASDSPTPTENSVSPEQGSGTGGAADDCLFAAKGGAGGDGGSAINSQRPRLGVASLRSTAMTLQAMNRLQKSPQPLEKSRSVTESSAATREDTEKRQNYLEVSRDTVELCQKKVEENLAMQKQCIKRSDSYQKIIEAADDSLGFFTRFRSRPSMKYLNIERIPPARGVKFLEFFNSGILRRERKIHETFPGGRHLIKVFSREGDSSEGVPTSYSENPEFQQRIKQERQLDRRFWKQLSKRRNSHSPNRQCQNSQSPTPRGRTQHVHPPPA